MDIPDCTYSSRLLKFMYKIFSTIFSSFPILFLRVIFDLINHKFSNLIASKSENPLRVTPLVNMLKYLQNKLQYLIEFSTQFASYDRSFYGLSIE